MRLILTETARGVGTLFAFCIILLGDAQCSSSPPRHLSLLRARVRALVCALTRLMGVWTRQASFLTGKDYIPAVNLLAVTNEGGGAGEGVGVEAASSGDDGLDAHGNEGNALCLHVLTTPSPVHSPEGQSEYLHYRFFNFEGGGLNDGASQWTSAGCAMRACRDALKLLASAWPSLSGRRAPLAGADARLTSNPPADDAGPLRELKAATGAETAENRGGELPWRVYFIVNPVSGHRMGEAIWHKIEPLFRVAGVPFDYLLTSHAGHASAVVAALDLSLYHVLICIGGDGTVSEVVNAIMRRGDADRQLARLALATLPAGSECALAKMVGFVQPLAAAWCILKGHRERAVDLLRITQPGATTYSICGVGWGIAGKLAEDSEALRSLYGPARYLVSGLKSFVSLKGCEGALEIQAVPDPSAQHECLFASHCPVCQATSGDGLRCGAVRAPPRAAGAAHHVTWKGPFVCVAILKTEKALVPHVHCNDGYVDVIAVPDVGRIELLRRSSKILMPDLMGHHLSQPETAGLASMDALSKGDSDFLYTKARSVVIKPRDRDDKFNVDGEVLDGEEMHVEVLPGKLRMLFAFHESAATHHAHKAASAGAGSIQGLVGGGIQVPLLCFPCWVVGAGDCCCLWLLLSLPRMYCNRGVLIGFKLLAFAVWKPHRQSCCAGLGRRGSRATLAQLGRIRADKVPLYPVT